MRSVPLQAVFNNFAEVLWIIKAYRGIENVRYHCLRGQMLFNTHDLFLIKVIQLSQFPIGLIPPAKL